MKQIFIDNEYLYDYLVENGKHTLLYSNSEVWNLNCRSSVALSVVDDGNGLKFSKKLSKLDYGDAERLFLLLRLLGNYGKIEIAEKQLL